MNPLVYLLRIYFIGRLCLMHILLRLSIWVGQLAVRIRP